MKKLFILLLMVGIAMASSGLNPYAYSPVNLCVIPPGNAACLPYIAPAISIAAGGSGGGGPPKITQPQAAGGNVTTAVGINLVPFESFFIILIVAVGMAVGYYSYRKGKQKGKEEQKEEQKG